MLSGLLCEIVSRIWGSHGALGVPKGGSLGGACGAVGGLWGCLGEPQRCLRVLMGLGMLWGGGGGATGGESQ